MLLYLEIFATFFFVFEAWVKIMAVGPEIYWDSPWNRMDFFIVVTSVIALLPTLLTSLPFEFPGILTEGAFAALRVVRVLRPLRYITHMPSLRVLIVVLIETVPLLTNIMILLLMVFLIFSVLGVQLFIGSMSQRCVDEGNNVYNPSGDPLEPYYCSMSDGQQCVANYTTCKADMGANPGAGMLGFDNTITAWLTVFEVITYQWSLVLEATMASTSSYSAFYFLLVVSLGGFFAMNLFIVVIVRQFSFSKNHEGGLVMQELERQESKAIAKELLMVKEMSGLMHERAIHLAKYCREVGFRPEAKVLDGIALKAGVAKNRRDMLNLTDIAREGIEKMRVYAGGQPGREPAMQGCGVNPFAPCLILDDTC